MYNEFIECFISHVSRDCNAVPDTLAAAGLNCINGPLLWQDHLPDYVALLASGELPGAYNYFFRIDLASFFSSKTHGANTLHMNAHSA